MPVALVLWRESNEEVLCAPLRTHMIGSISGGVLVIAVSASVSSSADEPAARLRKE